MNFFSVYRLANDRTTYIHSSLLDGVLGLSIDHENHVAYIHTYIFI